MAKTISGIRCTSEWARHLRKWGKRDANKRLRRRLENRLKKPAESST